MLCIVRIPPFAPQIVPDVGSRTSSEREQDFLEHRLRLHPILPSGGGYRRFIGVPGSGDTQSAAKRQHLIVNDGSIPAESAMFVQRVHIIESPGLPQHVPLKIFPDGRMDQ